MEHNCNYFQTGDATSVTVTTAISGGKHNHDHDSNCKHEHIKFCKKCEVPYCPDCGREWRETTQYYYPYFYYAPPTYTPWWREWQVTC